MTFDNNAMPSQDVLAAQSPDSLDARQAEFDAACAEIDKGKANLHYLSTTDSRDDKYNHPTTPSSHQDETITPSDDTDTTDSVDSSDNVTEPVTPEPTTTNGVDVESRLQEMQKYYQSQVHLANERLRSVANQYQDLKKLHEEQKNNVTDNLFNKLPKVEDVEAVIERDPEYAAALFKVFDQKLKRTTDALHNEVNKHIQPLQKHAVLTDAEKHRNAILAVHPDLDDLLRSKNVERWIGTLNPVMRAGAEKIYRQGSTADSIALLTEYKKATTTSKPQDTTNVHPKHVSQPSGNHGNSPKRQANPAGKDTADAQQQLMNKLKGGLAVPSGRSELPESSGNNSSSSRETEIDEFNRIARELGEQRRGLYVRR